MENEPTSNVNQTEPTQPTVTTSATLPSTAMNTSTLQGPVLQQPGNPIQNITPQSPIPDPSPKQTDIGQLVLEWLTYAFWWWTVLVLSILTGFTISYFMNGDLGIGNFEYYGIAGVLVLLPIAYTCDIFYSKKETEEKHGAELAIAAIHAVLFALIGVGALITAAFQIVSLLLNKDRQTITATALVISLVVFIYFLLTFLRALHPKKFHIFSKIYKNIMLGLVIVVCISTVGGPALSESRAKNDKLIENYLPRISSAINTYASKNNKLPASLNDITLTADAKKLVELNLVEYKPQTNASNYNQKSTTTNNQTYTPNSSYASRYSYNFNYDLCVNYVREKKVSFDYTIDGSEYETTTRQTSPNSYYHKKGNVCYELQTGY